MKFVEKIMLLSLLVFGIGFAVLGFAIAQEMPPVEDGYIPKPEPYPFYQECPFCHDPYTFLIGKERIAQPTLEYKYMREFLPFPTKKNPVIYVYACRDGHVWHLLRFGPPKVCVGGPLCVGEVE